MRLGGQDIKLQIWEPHGAERFRTITTVYYRKSDVMGVVYSVTDRSSFLEVPHWVKEIKQHAPERIIVMIGNKTDLREQR